MPITALTAAGVTYALYMTVSLIAAFLSRHLVHTPRQSRGVIAGALVVAAMFCPLVPKWIWADSPGVEELSLYLFWMLVCCTFVVALRIIYFVFLHPDVAASLPLDFLFVSFLFNPDERFLARSATSNRYIDRGLYSHPLWTMAIVPAKAALLAFLLLGPVSEGVEERLTEAVYTPKMFTAKYLLDGLLASLVVYPTLSVPFDLYLSLSELLTGIPMKPMFANPLFTTSPRDFWNERWNLLVKNTFHRTIFAPTVLPDQVFDGTHEVVASTAGAGAGAGNGHVDGTAGTDKSGSHKGSVKSADGEKRKEKVSFAAATAGSVAVFLVSALSHEWINYLAFDRLRLDNFVYFLLHALLTSMQVAVSKFSHPAIRTTIDGLPKWVDVAVMWVVMSWSVPIFLRDYLDAGFFGELRALARWVIGRGKQ